MNEACFVLISYCLMGFGSDKGAVQSLTIKQAQICSGRVGKAVGLQIPFFFFKKKTFFTFQLKS